MSAPTINSGHQQGNSTGNETTTVVTVPSSAPSGDRIFIAMVSDAASQGFTATGFTKHVEWAFQSAASALLAYKTSGGSESNYSIGLSVSERQVWLSWAVSGAASGIHANDSTSGNEGSSATASFSSITTTVDNCLLLRLVWTDGVTTPFGAMTDWTKLAEQSFTSAGSLALYYRTLATAGTEPSGTASLNVSEQWFTFGFALAPGSLSVTPTGIASGQAFGTPKIVLVTAPTGIASAAAFGTTLLKETISPTSIASGQAVGGPALAVGAVTVAPTGIATGQAVGSATVQRGAVTVAPTGISSGEALSSPQFNLRLLLAGLAATDSYGTLKIDRNIYAGDTGSAEAFGSLAIATGPVSILPTGLGSGETVPSPIISVAAQIISSAGGVASGQAIGSPQLNLRLPLTGVESVAAFGTLKTILHLLPSAIGGDEAFGTAELHKVLVIAPAGITTGQAIGGPTIITGAVTVAGVGGIAGAEAFGAHQVNLRLLLSAIAGAEAFGTAQLNRTLTAQAIAGSEAFGVAQVNRSILLTGIATGQALGATVVVPSTRLLPVQSIASAAAFGTLAISSIRLLLPVGIATAQALGSLAVQRGSVTIALPGIASNFDTGDHRLNLRVLPTGITSGQAFGVVNLGQPISLPGITSGFAEGTQRINLRLTLTGIASDFVSLSQRVHFGNQNILASGIATAQALGVAQLNHQLPLSGLESAAAFGVAQLNQRFGLTGITTSYESGAQQVNLGLPLPGIATGVTFGATALSQSARLLLASIAGAEVLGSATVARGSVAIAPAGISTGQTMGAATLAYRLPLTGIASALAFGAVTLDRRVYVLPSGMGSGQAFGAMAVVPPGATVQPSGIATAQAMGAAALAKAIGLTGITTGQAFGAMTLNRLTYLQLVGIAGTEVLGGLTVARGSVTIQPTGITSGQALGSSSLALRLALTGMATAQAFGAMTLAQRLFAGGLESASAFGGLRFALTVLPSGIVTAQAVGALGVGLIVQPSGIATAQALGAVRLASGINPAGIASAAAFGGPTVLPQPVTIAPPGIASGQAMGVTRIVWAIRPAGITSAQAFGSLIVTVFLASGRAWRVARGSRSWDVSRGARTFDVEK